MRTLAALLALVGYCFVSHTTATAQSQNCGKLCRDDYKRLRHSSYEGCMQDQLRHLYEPLSDKVANKHMCRLVMCGGNSALGPVRDTADSIP